MKKVFKVPVKVVTYAYTEIEADTKEEAIEIAETMDSGDFTPDEDAGYLEVIHDEVTELQKIKP